MGLFGCPQRDDDAVARVLVPESLQMSWPRPPGCPQTSSGAPGSLAEGEFQWRFQREEGGREMKLVWEQAWGCHLPASLIPRRRGPTTSAENCKMPFFAFEFPKSWESILNLTAAAAFFFVSSFLQYQGPDAISSREM